MDEAQRRLILGHEEDLLRPEFRVSATAVAALLAENFVEIGSSGRRYTRPEILAFLAAEPGTGAAGRLWDFDAQELAPGLVLATYCASLPRDGVSVQSLRSSLWRLREGRWQMLFH